MAEFRAIFETDTFALVKVTRIIGVGVQKIVSCISHTRTETVNNWKFTLKYVIQ